MKTSSAEQWIDVTVAISPGLVHWPGDQPFEHRQESSMRSGDVMNLSWIGMSAHTGTHMDAPLHFVDGAASLDALPLDAVIGNARVVQIGNPRAIALDEVKAAGIQAGERVLFKTANSDQPWAGRAFNPNFVSIPQETAAWLAEVRPLLIGVDYLSVGAFQGDGVETHRLLLGAGIWLVEGLDLTHVAPGNYQMVCLPLRLAGLEGGPARAALRRL